jgi:16S rRNA (adenine1518-N6/adenine1519-N6)-dimethyltransferase
MNGHIARKRFGQNFLEATGIVAQIVAAIAPRRGETVVEIGPGLGALTRPLLQSLDRLHVVEIDRDLIARLKQEFPPERLVIHEGDALEFDFATLGRDLKIVGNLPYNISTPLLFHLAGFADRVRDMHFMLQKEVVERMVAEPGSAAYGRLSVMLQVRFAMESLFIVPPESFRPAPKVDSAVVRMLPLAQPPLAAEAQADFAQLVSAAFSQRRKMLRNTLRDTFDSEDFAALGIAPTARAEELSVADYIRATQYLRQRQVRT